jgi:glycosyltransferase involved in cell wall biosynthesis
MILHLVPSIHPGMGGLAALSVGFAESQLQLGHDTRLWCTDSPARVEEAWRVHGFPREMVRRFPALPVVGFTPGMERAVAHEGACFQAVHQHGIWPMISRVTNRWREVFGRPTVVAPQGSLEPRSLGRSRWRKRLALASYEGTNLAQTTCLQANSMAEAEHFREFGLRQPIAVIPNGFPDAWLDSTGDGARFRSRQGLPGDRRLALFVARIHPIKGLGRLVRAVARDPQKFSDWLFVLAGPDEDGHRQQVVQLANQLGVADRFRFVGALYGDDKRDAYAAADFFLLPSDSESFGITVAEALGAGVPALTTHGAPWQELQQHDCGWWVPPTVDGIAEGLEAALGASCTRLEEMGQRGRELVARRYTWTQVGGQAVQLYQWLGGTGERPGFVILD